MEKFFTTAEPFHPGEYIADELEARGWTQDDLADITGITRRQIVNLIQGKSGISANTAQLLGQAFDQEPILWMNLQAAYELSLAAQQDRNVKRRADLFQKAPVRELIRRGWISDTKEIASLEADVCSLLQIPQITDQPNLSIAARKGTSYDADTAAQLCWYGRAFILAQGAPAARYSEGSLGDGVRDLVKLAAYPEDIRRVPAVLAEMGIRLVLIQHLRHTKIDGAAFWIDEQSPAIAMSVRFDRIDNFWFTLLHEVAHIYYRHEAPPIDVDIVSRQRDEDLDERERMANIYASKSLIQGELLLDFIRRVKPLYYESKIVQFAQRVGLHPGVVIGQLHGHPESGFEFKQLRGHLVKVREFIERQAITDGWGHSPQL